MSTLTNSPVSNSTAQPLRPGLALARAGAVFYILWSVLHVAAAFFVLPIALEPLSGLEPSAAHGRIYQNSGLMITISLAALLVAVTQNWRNDLLGYWINLILISGTDIAFIAFVLIPGYEPPPQGLIGPSLWIVGLVLSTWGLLQARRAEKSGAHK